MASPFRHTFKSICVFSGTSFGNDKAYLDEANNLGRILAEKKINLIYGGGSSGLVGCVSSSAYLNGSRLLGILPSILANSKVLGFSLGNELKVSSMHEKMANMLINADAFIALPGGLGTLEEVFNIASWAQLNLHQKPLGLLNINGFYDGLLAFLDHNVEQGFMTPRARKILVSAPTANQLLDQLQIFVPQPDPLIAVATWTTVDNKRTKKQEMDLTLRL